MRRLRQSLAAVLVVALCASAGAASAEAKTIDVRPQGPAVNVIQRAIHRASPGDRIRVHHGDATAVRSG